VKIIAKQPGISRPSEELGPEFREWLIGFGDSGYIVLYRYDGQTAVIVAV
jgi:plasmid stabilization system protein ParE